MLIVGAFCADPEATSLPGEVNMGQPRVLMKHFTKDLGAQHLAIASCFRGVQPVKRLEVICSAVIIMEAYLTEIIERFEVICSAVKSSKAR